jgi:NADPH2:quinone reductase
MNAVVFKKTGDWLEVLEAQTTFINEPAEHEVQVQVFYRPINPSDEMFIQGVYRQQPTLPQIAGLEGAGVIVKCGASIDPSYLQCRVIFRARGTWAEFINLSLDQVRLVPAEIPFPVACQLSLNTLSAYALLQTAALKAGDHLVLTAGTSSLVQQVIQLANLQGIKTIAIIRNKKGSEKIPADYIVNLETDDLKSFLIQHNIPGVQASLDAVGGVIASQLIQIAAPFSRIIIYGRLSPDAVSFTNGDIIYRNLTITGFGIDAWIAGKTKEELEEIWEMIYRLVILKKLVVPYDKLMPLSAFKEGIRMYKAGAGRILLGNA